MIELTIVSFVAGVLTVLAPCILPLLPVVVGGSALHGDSSSDRNSLKHPLIITLSLAVSAVVFTLLLKATTTFLGVPVGVWNGISGGIILLFGINLLFPALWERAMIATGLQASTMRLMSKSQDEKGIARDILLGFSLGLVFNSCSPTYALIVGVILPTSFATGLVYLVAYALGLAVILLLISIFGRALIDKLKWLSNPNGWFKKFIGILFVLVGLAVVFGIDKQIQAFVLQNGWYDPIMRIEESFRTH